MRTVQQRRAVPALRHVRFHLAPHFGRNVALKVVRKLAPDVFAVKLHGDTPLDDCGAVLRRVRSTKISRNISLARSSPAFVFPMLIPRISEVSAIFSPTTSRNVSTSRYISGNSAIDSRRSLRVSSRTNASIGISRQSASIVGV